jgi:hypothetical protein
VCAHAQIVKYPEARTTHRSPDVDQQAVRARLLDCAPRDERRDGLAKCCRLAKGYAAAEALLGLLIPVTPDAGLFPPPPVPPTLTATALSAAAPIRQASFRRHSRGGM